jgi:hypothetical protein
MPHRRLRPLSVILNKILHRTLYLAWAATPHVGALVGFQRGISMCSQEEYPKASTIQATFDQRVGQLAEASENYHREGVSFVRGLLDPNPSTRMTAEGALAHPFLTGSFPEVPPGLVPTKVERPPPILKTTMDRLLWEACGELCNEKYDMTCEDEVHRFSGYVNNFLPVIPQAPYHGVALAQGQVQRSI